MKRWEIIMGMPVSVEIRDSSAKEELFGRVFDYFRYIDGVFSTYKPESEISKINRGLVSPERYSNAMREIFQLAKETKVATGGYFDMQDREGNYDPSGIVKGWAIWKASQLLLEAGVECFYVEAGGDIQVYGQPNQTGWQVGIRNPFQKTSVVKVVQLAQNEGVATSGNYERGGHVYNPKNYSEELDEVASLTVIGPNIYEADRFATAAFAMGKNGIQFIESMPGFEGYQIDKDGLATMTSGFEQYVIDTQ